MQNFLILSDVHGDRARLRQVIALHRTALGVIFLGDGLLEVSAVAEAAGLPLFAVRGNCDPVTATAEPTDEERLITVGEHRVLLLHGHTVGVKGGGEGGLIAMAHAHRADVVLYGHTHERCERYLRAGEGGPLTLFNPGSLGRPMGSGPSFGTLTVNDRGELLFGFGEVR